MRAGQIFGDVARHAGLTKDRGQFMGARLWRSLKFAQHNLTVRRVLNDARLDTIEADEAEAAQDFFRRKQACQLLLVAQTILKGDHGRARADERREQFWELVVGGSLKCDQDNIADA